MENCIPQYKCKTMKIVHSINISDGLMKVHKPKWLEKIFWIYVINYFDELGFGNHNYFLLSLPSVLIFSGAGKKFSFVTTFLPVFSSNAFRASPAIVPPCLATTLF